MKNKITYDSLLQDDRFLSDAYYALQGLGETVTNDRKEVLDKFLQNVDTLILIYLLLLHRAQR